MPTMTIEPISQIEVVRFTAAFGPGYSTCGHEHVLIEEAQACADDMRSITNSIPGRLPAPILDNDHPGVGGRIRCLPLGPERPQRPLPRLAALPAGRRLTTQPPDHSPRPARRRGLFASGINSKITTITTNTHRGEPEQ